VQFLAPAFADVTARHPLPRGGQIPPSVYDPHDAIYAAAFYLCDNGAGRDLRAAIFAYNHANWYVDEVLAQAHKYCETTSNASVACPTFQSTLQSSGEHFSSRALLAVRFACAQLGKPYVWGGNGDPGFDCSGLTKAAYAAAGIDLPRTAQTQYDAGPRLPAGASLLPGDLVFFGTPTHIHHVGISLGGALIVNAPTFGQPVQVADYHSFGDYAGASRPTN
jgi:cell wall-associated NlpC family hydrolase